MNDKGWYGLSLHTRLLLLLMGLEFETLLDVIPVAPPPAETADDLGLPLRAFVSEEIIPETIEDCGGATAVLFATVAFKFSASHSIR